MAESAALLVDDILPEAPMRQWLLSFPFPLRFLFASQPAIMSKVLGIVYRALGTLDRKEFGVDLRMRTLQMVRHGVRFTVILVTVLATLVVLAETASQLMNLGEHCMFPPCY